MNPLLNSPWYRTDGFELMKYNYFSIKKNAKKQKLKKTLKV